MFRRGTALVVERLAALGRELAYSADDRLERVDEAEDDLAAGDHLELAGTAFGPVAQPAYELARPGLRPG